MKKSCKGGGEVESGEAGWASRYSVVLQLGWRPSRCQGSGELGGSASHRENTSRSSVTERVQRRADGGDGSRHLDERLAD
jgi:hypothetical protein